MLYDDLAAGLFTSSRVQQAMLAVDRADFCPRGPYDDEPKPIGYNATITAPHMVGQMRERPLVQTVPIHLFQHAHALECLKEHLTEGAKVLDVGSGSGYLTACMAHMVSVNHLIPLNTILGGTFGQSRRHRPHSGAGRYVRGQCPFTYEFSAGQRAIAVGGSE